ncbi:enterotoxin A family protein, partial [Paraburkholderia azotifigens]|uniref:enterotoxin A family protein n=1 Tax=Paraburkholderia azotifigens TaxID=2057004 RepID=UPI0031709920
MSISRTRYGNNLSYRYDHFEQEADSASSDETSADAGAAAIEGLATRARRQTQQPYTDAREATFNAYGTDSDRKFEYRGPETRAQELEDTCAGQTTEAMRLIAEGKSSDLTGAIRQTRANLRNPATRGETIRRIRQLQEKNKYWHATRLPGYTHRLGGTTTTGTRLVEELASQLKTRHMTNDGSGSEQYTLVSVDLQFPEYGHAITIQRLHPSDDYRNDEYELHDPSFGVFHYRNFRDLSAALLNLYAKGYRDAGGITGARTTYYADSRTYRALDPSRQRSRLSDTPLSGIGNRLTPPSTPLPPPPDFDQPGPSGWQGHSELKRDLNARVNDRHPFALYRPSTVSPEDLKRQNGFVADDMPVGDVSLDMYDDDVQRGKDNVDGAGFLGTFRGEDTARQKMNAGGKDGYIYYVAPTPNMVDTNG